MLEKVNYEALLESNKAWEAITAQKQTEAQKKWKVFTFREMYILQKSDTI